jgi:hypothetical protein
MSADDITFVSADQLPDDPATMPPPYWRSGGSGLHLEDALDNLLVLLHQLAEVTPLVRQRVKDFKADPLNDPENEDVYAREMRLIYQPAWRIEDQLLLKCDVIILMAAIQAEELVNRFCVYNLPKELVEALEKVSVAEKLVAGASHLGRTRVRATTAHEALASLFRWRNAFAHGHCVDRPTKSLRHNHLLIPERHVEMPESIAAVTGHLIGLERIAGYIAEVSVNSYTKNASDISRISFARAQLQRFKLTGSPILYDLDFDGSGA